MGTVEVYWNARNLGSNWNIGAGNHHYILIVTNGNKLQGSIPTQNCSGAEFITLGGFNIGGNMVFMANNPEDSASAREIFSNSSLWNFLNPFDWGAQKHLVKPPNGNSLQFASQVVRLALNYEINTRANPLPYSIEDDNCAAWVNTLFKAAGIPLTERTRLGQFWGIDWAERLEIPENLFKGISYIRRHYNREANF